MALQVGDILQISIRGELFNQRMLTVLHYRITVGTFSGTVWGDVNSWAAWFAGQIGAGEMLTSYLAVCGNAYTLESVRAQLVSPTRSAYASQVVNLTGTAANDCRQSNISASITKRGNGGGRWATGRVQMPAVPSDDCVDGLLSVAYQTNIGDLLTNLQNPQVNAPISQTAVPVIFNPGRAPNWTEILEHVLQTQVRTMHRRTVQLGE